MRARKRRTTDANSPRLRHLLMEDMRRSDFSRTLKRDLRNLYLFYLDEERRQRLASMGRIRRVVTMLLWLMKSLILRLSPARRLLLVASLVLSVLGKTRLQIGTAVFDRNLGIPAYLLLLLVLMLELRDKLLARDEIEVARQVQLALLPREAPVLAGWTVWSHTRPANDVGGDLIDFVDTGGDRLGIALGDVAGKGMGAALLMAKLQATLRAVVSGVATLGELGARLNLILHRDGLDNRYATLFYVEAAPDSGRLRYLNAGHNPPFLVRAGNVTRLEPTSIPLGMLPDSSYAEGRLDLEPGDLLVIYSDGLTEARRTDEEEFGEDRLRALLPGLARLSVPDAGRAILKAVDDFIVGERPHDDLSLVLIRRQPATEGGLP
jgi:phosphoserine phosphatase RsbU/P